MNIIIANDWTSLRTFIFWDKLSCQGIEWIFKTLDNWNYGPYSSSNILPLNLSIKHIWRGAWYIWMMKENAILPGLYPLPHWVCYIEYKNRTSKIIKWWHWDGKPDGLDLKPSSNLQWRDVLGCGSLLKTQMIRKPIKAAFFIIKLSYMFSVLPRYVFCQIIWQKWSMNFY